MPCFKPREAYPAAPPAKGVVWSSSKSYAGAVPFSLPCGSCIGCRLDKSQDWATRIVHESQLHRCNSFVTLTFAPEHLPEDGSVSTRDLQLFMKRLRKAVGTVRFFACGEYGGQGDRPHYHLILFGYDPPDRKPWRRTPSGHLVYRSATLEKVWPFGHVEVGEVTVQSAAYVARYVTKKVTGDAARDHYTRLNPVTGELVQVRPEFICMSNRPGIGSQWFEQYSTDAFPSDFVVIEGKRRPVPRYYKKKLSEREALLVTAKRKERARLHSDNNTPERLTVREEVTNLRAERLKRDFET